MNFINAIPIEVLQLIFAQINDDVAVELSKLELVCKKWQEAASADILWRPQLAEFKPREYKKLSREALKTNTSIKSLFARATRKDMCELQRAVALISDTNFSLAGCNQFQQLMLIKQDATSFFEHLIEKNLFHIVLSFLSKNVSFAWEKIFGKLLLIDVNQDFENRLFYLWVVKKFLDSKMDFRSVFNHLDEKDLKSLNSLMELMCVEISVSLLRFVECGLNPNILIPNGSQKKIPLIYIFIRSCWLDSSNAHRRHAEQLSSKKVKQVTALKKIYGIDCTIKPISQEELICDFKIFLEHKELEINARTINNDTVLVAVRHLKTWENADQQFFSQIEKMLLDHGAH